jgi:hypothetical protein
MRGCDYSFKPFNVGGKYGLAGCEQAGCPAILERIQGISGTKVRVTPE